MNSTKQPTRKNSRETRINKLAALFADGKWHSTNELARRVGAMFSSTKQALIDDGIRIEKRRHKTKRFQWQYRVDRDNPIAGATDDRGGGMAQRR